MTEEDEGMRRQLQEVRIRHGLSRYCDWLNAITRQMDPGWDYIYRPDDEVDRAYWGPPKVIAEYYDGWYDVLVVRWHPNDEGGPHALTFYFNSPSSGAWQGVGQDLWHATQMFDTMLGQWMNEGKLQTFEGEAL